MKDALIGVLLVLVALLAVLGDDHASNEALIDDVSAAGVHRTAAGTLQRPDADPDLLFAPCPVGPRNLPINGNRDALNSLPKGET